MRICSQTETELVVRDSSLWISALLILGGLLPLWFAFHGDFRGFRAFGGLLLFAIAWLRRSTFTFDATTQTIRWIRFRYYWTRTGSIPFSEVRGIETQSMSSAQSNQLIYRLSIVTAQSTVPMSDVYSSGEQRCASIRDTILHFLHLDHSFAQQPATPAVDTSVRSLLRQGRKIDAIHLLCNAEDIDVTTATQRINEIDTSTEATALR
jgi:hypothetical protein